MNFQDFHFLKTHQLETKQFTHTNSLGQECPVNVIQYLPISDKNDLIATALQKAEENGLYNEILLDVYFHLNIVYLYTDIEFSQEDRGDELELYDLLETNEIIDKVIAYMPEEEYQNLKELLVTMRDLHMKYDNSAAAVMRRIITDLPKNAAAAQEIIDNFNPEKYQAVADFATAANGGRNINTNMAPVQTQTVPIKPVAAPQDHLKKTPRKKIVTIQSDNKKD